MKFNQQIKNMKLLCLIQFIPLFLNAHSFEGRISSSSGFLCRQKHFPTFSMHVVMLTIMYHNTFRSFFFFFSIVFMLCFLSVENHIYVHACTKRKKDVLRIWKF